MVGYIHIDYTCLSCGGGTEDEIYGLIETNFFVIFFLLEKMGPVRESNPGPRAPEARIIPLDQQA